MPHCPECKKPINIPEFKIINAIDAEELMAPIALVYCPNCECILGVAGQETCQAE